MDLLHVRKELRFVSYIEGERLVRQGWRIAKEEDTNHVLGFVFLELVEESLFLKRLKRVCRKALEWIKRSFT